jgi:hypothetical protein
MDLEQVQPFPKNRIVVAISCKNLLIGRGGKKHCIWAKMEFGCKIR